MDQKIKWPLPRPKWQAFHHLLSLSHSKTIILLTKRQLLLSTFFWINCNYFITCIEYPISAFSFPHYVYLKKENKSKDWVTLGDAWPIMNRRQPTYFIDTRHNTIYWWCFTGFQLQNCVNCEHEFISQEFSINFP